MSLPGGYGEAKYFGRGKIDSVPLRLPATWLNGWLRLDSDQQVFLRSDFVISATPTATSQHSSECIVQGRHIHPAVLSCRRSCAAGAANSDLEARRHLRHIRSSPRHERGHR